jgi:hypothetical protein
VQVEVYRSSGFNNVRIARHPVTVDLDGAEEAFTGNHIKKSFQTLFCL